MVYILYLIISIFGLSLAGDTVITIYSISSVSYSTSSTYKIVSLEGGAYLYIKGAGFSSISPSNNQVSIGGVDCPVIEFLTTSTQVVCLVPPSDTETTVQVTVTSDGARTGTCTSCYLRYYYYNTPTLAYMIPSAGNPGQEVDYYGRSRVPSSQYVDYIKIGDYRCNANDQNEFDYVTFTGSYLSAPCNLPVIEAGYYSVSQRNRVYTGYAKNLNSLPVYRYGNDPYDFAIVPQITSISNNIGSSEGQILTIKGVGFSSTGQNEVYLADTECTIITQSETEIQCELQARSTLTTPIPDQGYHAGLKFAFYQGGTLSNALSGGTPTSTGTKLTFEIGYGIGSYYSDKTSGYFKAPVTGDYTFFMSADDQAQLFISTTPLVKTGLQQIISITSYSYYRYFYKSADMSQVSDVISLVADNYYYMELYHAQGSGDNFATVGVQIPNSPNTVNTLPEVKLIKINCDTIFEILEFSISATGGYWRIRLDYVGSDGITITSTLKTGNMTYNAAASTVSSAISGSLGIKNTAVRDMLKSDGTITTNSSEAKVYQYTVTLQSIRHNGKFPVIETSNLIGTSVYGQVSQLRVPSPAVRGTFTISAKNTTADMDYYESESSMESKLRTMGYLDPIRVVLNGDTDLGAGWRIQFTGDRAPLEEFTISYSLTGCSAPPNVTVSTIQSASDDLFYEVIPVDYLFTAEDNPQITIKSNGITGNCPGFNCDYVIQDTGIPIVTTASYSAPTLTLSVDGVTTGQYTSDQIRVFFGNTECTVTNYHDSAIPASLTADCPTPEAGDFTPKVHFNDLGYASTDPSVVPITVGITISTVTPAQINANGGTALTITGTGFPDSSDIATLRGMAINLDTATCTIDSVTPTQIICISTPVTADSALTISLNGQTATSTTLTLLPAVDVPTITSVTPDSVSPVLQTTITIVGSDFDSDTSSTTITLSNTTNSQVAQCVPDSASSPSTQIICNLFGAPTGNYLLTVITSLGSSNSMPFSVNTIITSISPSSGSTAGGTTLTIQGTFFSSDMEQTLVYIGTSSITCDVTSSAPSQVQCITRAKSVSYDETPQAVVVTTRLVEQSVCDIGATCTFSYLDALTPQITALGATSVSPGDNLEITGLGLDSNPAGTPPTVNIGGIDCAIVSNIDTQIIATVPLNVVPSQNSTIIVNVAGKGNALFTSVNATIIVTPKIVSVTPASGSTAGSLLTITGAGFQTGATIKVGSTACDIRSLTSTVITCKSASTGEINLAYGNFTSIKCSPTCTLTTSSTLTPTITSVSPISPSDPTAFTLTIIGTKFTVGTPVSVNLISKTDKTIIFIGSITTTPTTTQIVADFSNVAAGTYSVEVQSGASIASSTVIVTVPLSATVPTPIVSSIAGGTTLTITGSGFFDNPQNTNNKVSVCGFSCPVTQSTPTSIDCQVPLYINTAVQTAYPGLVATSLLVAPVSWSDTGKQSTVLDLAYTTVYSSSKADCQIGFDIGAGLLAQISEIKFFPNLAVTASKFNTTVIEGSSDNVTYTNIATLDANTHDRWNTLTLATPATYRYYRLRGSGSAALCALAELQFYGVVLSDSTITDLEALACDVQVTVNDQTQSVTSAVTYEQSQTSTLTSISRVMGPSAGGDTLTLTGTGFITTVSDIEVLINGVSCAVSTATSTEITCVTGAAPDIADRISSLESTVTISFAGQGDVIVGDITYFYVDKWSDINTWGGETPPREGDSVSIPSGQTILLDMSPPKLKGITVEGALIFNDQDITLDCDYIFVNNGRLQIGTNDNPIQNTITVTLYGDSSSPQVPIFGNKMIGLMEGILDIHGKERSYTWTVLDSTANIGDTSITVQQEVDWAPGEQIVIASSDHDPYSSEVREILTATINSGTTIITFADPLVNSHYAGTQTIDSATFEMRAEVGLLTRNVVIQGDDTSENLQYGAHIMAHSNTGDDSSIVRISYTEVRQAGQAFNLGRYPIHLHMIGNVKESSLIGNSVHHSYNRGISMHGVHFMTVQNNVAYWIMGHTIFTEDGIETNNVIENNLVINTMASNSLLNTDLTPASFWIRNPNNIVTNNHAAGSDRYGFWFELKGYVEGAASTNSICPDGEILGQFSDNQAHSSTRSGLRIYQEYIPRRYPCIDYSNYDTNPPIQSDFTNFLGWRNTEAAVIAETIGSVKFSNIKTADNIRAGIEISSGNTSPPDSWLVQDASIVGMSPDNAGDNSVYVAGGTRGLITPRVDYFLASSVSFSNFGSNMTAIETCSHCEHNSATDSGARTSFFEDLSFNNVNRRVKFNTPYKEILVDRDGTLTDNTAGGSGVVTYYYDHLDVPGCIRNNAVYHGLVCDQTVTIRRIEFAGLVTFGTFQGIVLNILRIENNPTAALGQIPYRPLTRQSWATPFVTGYTYQLIWANQADFSSLLITPSDVIEATDRSVTVIFNHTAYRETYDIFPSNLTLKSAIANTTVLWDSTTADSLQTGDWYHNVTGQELYIVVNGKNKQEMKVNAIGCRVNCPLPTSSIPKDGILRLWSNVTQWPSGQIPGDGANIEIPAEWTVKLDMNSAKLGTLHIMGDMLFDDTVDNLVLTAERIWVEGQLFIGTSTDALYTSNAKILLTGNRTSQDLLIGNVQDVGNKVLAVTGNLTLLGETVNYVYVRLQAPAYAGDMTITVPSGVDWEVGNQIVISPTQRVYNEYEVRTITAISAGVITLNSSLQYYHFGATSVTKSTLLGDLDMRAEVGLLTRNIVIEATDEDLWGGRIYVGEIYDSELNSYSRGRVNMVGVEMINLGQPNTTQAGVTFDSLVSSNNDGCVVSQCVVRDSLGVEMKVIGSTGITIDSNIFFRSYNTQVLFEEESTGILFTNNLLIGNEDPSLLNETGVAFGASFYANVELLSSEVSGNIISGCYQQCLFTLGGDCTSQANGPYTVYDNIAHSGQIGWLVNSPNEDCNAITDFTGYKLEQGIATMFQSAQLKASNIIVSDTEIGISLNIGGVLDATTISLTNSYAAGVTPTGVLDSYNNTAECSNLTGVLLPVSLTSPKSIPPSSSQLPWYKIESDHIWQSTFTMSGVTFENFDDTVVSNCTSNFAIRSNHYASDASASTQLSNITLINVADANKIYFEKPNAEWIDINACGGWFCTGLSNILVRDLDGTFANNNIATSLMPANNNTIDSTTCAYNEKNNANICIDKGWGLLTFESLDSDDLTRVLSPVQVTNTNYSNQLNSYMDHLWDGTSSLNRRSRFHAVVQSGLQYQISFVSSVPDGLRWSLQGALSTESVSVSYGYVNPQSMRVTDENGNIIKPIVAKLAQDKVIKSTDACGTNVYNIDNKTISIQITGEGTCRLDIVNTNSIKGSLKYSVGIDDFFSQNGPAIFVNKIAALLNVNSSLVRIVDVKSGSTLLTFFVDSNYQDNTTESDSAAKAELTSMVNTLTNAVSSGDLSILDSTILNYSFDIILLRPTANKTHNARNVVIIVAAVFVGVLALIFGAYFAYRRYTKKKEIPYQIELNKRRPRLQTESSVSMHTENPLVSTSRFDVSASPYIVRDISISRPRDFSPDHV